jgi:hypothetical protein
MCAGRGGREATAFPYCVCPGLEGVHWIRIECVPMHYEQADR